jgi:hypothetical protein
MQKADQTKVLAQRGGIFSQNDALICIFGQIIHGTE